MSVIVPVWNMGRFLPDAIASIPDVHEILIVVASRMTIRVRLQASLRGGGPASLCSTIQTGRLRPRET